MGKLSSVSDFQKWQQELERGVNPDESVITICGGTGCTAMGSAQVYEAFKQQIERQKLGGRVRVKQTGCHGFCEKGPLVVILPKQFFYTGVDVGDVEEIVSKSVLGGEPIDRLLYRDPASGKKFFRAAKFSITNGKTPTP